MKPQKITIGNFIFSEQEVEQPCLPASVAVHLHLFYPDLVLEFQKYIGHIPCPVSLFISIPKNVDANEQYIEKSFHALPNIREIIIKRTPNRGRDIAPMLCSFAEEIQRHKIMLHLHSKKSIHETSLNGWLHFILEHILPNDAIVSIILSKMNQGVGMIAPPDYVCHMAPDGWSDERNLIFAQQLMDRAQMGINLKEEYPEIDFPQGSMFWARNDYLHKLFALNLSYNDFPEEPIGVDGTIAHALERVFFLWGKDSGMTIYKTYFYKIEAELQYRHRCEFKRILIHNQKLYEEKEFFWRRNRQKLIILRSIFYISIFIILAILCIKIAPFCHM